MQHRKSQGKVFRQVERGCIPVCAAFVPPLATQGGCYPKVIAIPGKQGSSPQAPACPQQYHRNPLPHSTVVPNALQGLCWCCQDGPLSIILREHLPAPYEDHQRWRSAGCCADTAWSPTQHLYDLFPASYREFFHYVSIYLYSAVRLDDLKGLFQPLYHENDIMWIILWK